MPTMATPTKLVISLPDEEEIVGTNPECEQEDNRMSAWVDVKPTVISLPRRPGEEEIVETNHERKQEGRKRPAWVDVTPLKKLMVNQRSSFGRGVQIQEGCKLLRELYSPDKKRQQQQQKQEDTETPLMTPRGSKEDVQCVYGRFETLLNVLRVERHKEKLEADQEIQLLRNKITLLEQAHGNNVKDSSKPKRKSLGSITNILPLSPSSQPQGKSEDVKGVCNIPEPSVREYEKKILEYVKQLMGKEREVESDMDRELLAWYFDEESNNKALEKERMELQQKVVEQYDFKEDEMPLRYFTALKEIQQQHERVMDEVAKNSLLTIKLEQVQEELKQVRQETTGEQQDKGSIEGSNEDAMSPQIMELHDKLNEIQTELTGSNKNRSDILMKLAVESTQKASLSMKLEAAVAQIEKQKQTISLLNQELGKAKYECEMYLQKEHEVLEESKQLLVEDGARRSSLVVNWGKLI